MLAQKRELELLIEVKEVQNKIAQEENEQLRVEVQKLTDLLLMAESASDGKS